MVVMADPVLPAASPAPAPVIGLIGGDPAGPLQLSVVVPLYNEEGSLSQLVDQLLNALRPLGKNFLLI